jgi:small conductance mechanosensitive channel
MWEVSGYFDRLLGGLANWGQHHLANIVVIIIGAYVARHFGAQFFSRVIHRTVRPDLYPTELARKKRLQTLDGLVGAITQLMVWIIAIIMIVNELGIQTAPLVASAGVIGLTLAFGAQSLIKDFVSGVFIITENQYRVGDVVKLNDVAGAVEAIGIRTTVLRDLDGKLHHIPNGTITVSTNMTTGYSNVNEDITVNFDTDIALLEHVINHVGQQVAAKAEFKPKILEPPHFAAIIGFSQTGIVVKILAKTLEGEHWAVRGEMYRLLKKAFDQHKIGLMPMTAITMRSRVRKV